MISSQEVNSGKAAACLYNVIVVNGRADGWGFIIIGIGGSSGGNW